MGSLIHGSVESQISAIVTVCWWVDRDWNWLPWQPVMTSTNLNICFQPMLAWLLSLTNSPCGKNHLSSCLFLLSNDTYWWLQYIQEVSNLCSKCQPVCCDLTWPCPLLPSGKTKIHINTGRIIYGHCKGNWQHYSLNMYWLLWLEGVPCDYFGSLKPDITYWAKYASI